MSYTYPIDPAKMFEDRLSQILSFGIPKEDVAALQSSIQDMWADAPGGWVYEWSKVAAGYADKGDHYLSAMAYGWAKFPCLADQAKSKAMRLETEQYIKASQKFPVKFERRILKLPYAKRTVDVAVHLLGGPENRKQSPVLLASGGVDTWKIDFHPLLLALAQGTGLTLMAFDMPGTGETEVPLNSVADEIIMGLIQEARSIGNGRVAHFGMSFGANFSAMTGLSGAVDAAVNLGGPVNAAFHEQNLRSLPYGMADILGNAFGFDHSPDFEAFSRTIAGLSRARLLEGHSNSPMLVINGADDYFVPQADTAIFNGRAQTEVHLIPGTGHCAISKLKEFMPIMINWLRTQML
jgi:esterase FrsA